MTGKKIHIDSFFTFLLIVLLFHSASSQNTYSSEEDLKKGARKLFDNEQYAEAYPLYSQLLSVYPKDPNYNYRFGICMLYTGENKEKPISYLEYASKQPDVEKDVFFFLGKAYHINYRFDDAIQAYNRFKNEASAFQQKKFQVENQINMCRNGKTLLKNITDLQVLEKKQVSDNEFFRSYDLSAIGGKLLVKPEDFQSTLDKKAKQQTIIYLAKNNEQIFYSSYGTDGKSGKDIYMVSKLSNGEWSLPTNIGSPVNTDSDEDYPFLHPNGKVLYFCSKGHNSMGGYDIFKSTRSSETAAWSEPVNMDFSINTPDDDILYVTDSLEHTAYFSSKRSSPNGMIDVYKISTERKPVEVAVINGTVGKDEEGQIIKSKISVKNAVTGELVGLFTSDPQTGQYNMNVPGASKLLFTVESEGYQTQSEVVVLPGQPVFKPFRQEIGYEAKSAKLYVKNFFDEAIDDNNYLLALNFIKEKARMDVNANEALLKETQPASVTEDTVSQIKKDTTTTNGGIKPAQGTITNNDLVKIAYDDAEETQKEAKEIKSQADQALSFASLKNEEAQAKYAESDAAAKQGDVSASSEKRKEADKISRETVAAFNLAKKLDNDAVAKQEEADLSLNYAKELDAAAKSTNSAAAIQQLEEQKNRLENLSQKPKGADNAYNSIKQDADNKQKEVEQTKEKNIQLQNEIKNIDTEVQRLEQDVETTKNEQLKEGLKGQINDLKDDKEKKKQEIISNENKIPQLEKEAANLKNEAELVNGMIVQIKSGSETPANITSIDKQKLQEQVNGYQMNDAEVKTDTQQPTEAQQATQTEITAANQPTPTNVETNKPVTSTTVDQTLLTTGTTYDKKYINNVSDANQINDEYTRETTKSGYYKSWADSIKADIVEKKSELNTQTDDVKKKEIEQTIAALEASAKEKQDLSDKSKAKATASLSGSLITTSSVADTTSKTTSANPQIANENTTPDTTTNKAVNNANTATMPVEKRTDTLLVNNPPVTKNDTASLQTPLQKKDDQQSEVQQPVEKTNSLENKTTTSEAQQTEVVKQTTQQTVEPLKTSAKPPNGSETVTTDTALPVEEKNKENTEALNRANSIAKEAEDLNGQAMALRNAAYAKTDLAERDADLQKANDLDKQAVQKQQEAANLSAQIKTDEFKKNDEQLASYSKSFAGNQADDIMMADMIRDEAKYYFEEARKSREKATMATSFSVRQGNLDVAEQNEKTAFEKQAKAAEMYAKFKPSEAPIAAQTQTPSSETSPSANTPLTPSNTPNEVKPQETTTTTSNIKKSSPDTTIAVTDSGTTEQLTNKNDLTTSASTKPNETENVNKTQNIETPNNTPANQNLPAEKKTEPNQQPVANETTNENKQSSIVSQQNLREVQDTKEYGHYVDVKTSSDSIMQVAKSQYTIADNFQLQTDAKNKEAEPMLKQIDEIPEGTTVPDSLTKRVEEIKSEAKALQLKADSTREEGKQLEEKAKAKQTESEMFLMTLDDAKAKQIQDAYAGQYGSKQVSATNNELDSKKSSKPKTPNQPKVVAQPSTKTGSVTILAEGFEISATPVYSDAKPIPIDTKLPEGLLFKVQIGAFKNPISQTAFKGLNPITGETTQSGMIRYTAGLFRDLQPAKEAKSRIQSVGYRDAFIVAFYNGKRITYNEAMAMLSGTKPTDQTASNASSPIVPDQNNLPENVGTAPANTSVQQSKQDIAPSTDIATVQGTIYTIQVGVYSKPVTSAQLFNIQPLYTETMNNSLKRYTSGAYTDINEAIKAKNNIVKRGIKDAFIIVYKDGKRVAGNDLAPSNNPLSNNTGTSETPGTTSSENGIVFKVQVGAYKTEVPIEVANKMLSISSKGVNITKDESGTTIYSVGSCSTYDEAVKIKNELVTSGVADAFVTAYNKGKKMDLDKAKQATKK